MKTISTSVIAFLLVGFLFLALPEKGYSGFPSIPGGPPCCEFPNVSDGNGVCEGGDGALERCLSVNCEMNPNCEFIENATCVLDEENSNFGRCLVDPPPTVIPSTANVPTLSVWGLLSLAVVLAIVGLGVIIARRKKVSA